jgi:hypothetical protein
MNPEKRTTEKLEKLREVTLSESSRTRIHTALMEYASFNSADTEVKTPAVTPVPFYMFMSKLHRVPVPFMLLMFILVGGGMSFTAEGTVPGDFLYPVKTEFNETIRSVFTMNADRQAELQTELLEERISEAEALQVDGRLNDTMSVAVSDQVNDQAERANEAVAKSSPQVASETQAKISGALEHYLAIENPNPSETGDVTMTMKTSDLATGLYDVNSYQADMEARTTALAKILETHKAEIDTPLHKELTEKLTQATELATAAATQTEADGRTTLDEAALLTGEIEAKLSTLGLVEIDIDTGMIVDIDFSIDPMQIDRGEGFVSPNEEPQSNSGATESGPGL